MCRPWVWIMAIALVLAGGAWNFATGMVYDLTKLKSICIIVEDLTLETRKDHGLSREAIGQFAYVSLKGKLPRVRMELFTGVSEGICDVFNPLLFVRVMVETSESVGGDRIGHYGYVGLLLVRRATWESGRRAGGGAFISDLIISGSMGAAWKVVKDALDVVLTTFAAEYYKAGNP